jgi:Tol biopolymer transport system component
MALISGTRLGSYEIVSLLGAGGMGEVYRARDTNLGREVALKTLPDSVTHDPERLARFRREAQVLAALNHPHIAAIYGIEEANGQRFLVLELVEGETLAARIAKGPLPVDEALAIAREIAEGLQSAHDKGIIHRDLKPANIALTPHDRVKVLDFGLAKATDTATTTGAIDQLNSPTVTSPAMLTGMGVILGTAAYMSPEQARGRAADKRSDVWAFGCVLYEMLTGRRPFEGDDVSDTLAAVLKSDPAWDALPSTIPPSVRSLLEACLVKNPSERIGDVSTILFVLRKPSAVPALRPAHATSGRSRAAWAGFALAGAAVGAAAVIALWPRQAAPPRPVTRFGITVPGSGQLTLSRPVLAVSPDGTRVVFAADGRLYLRSLTDLEARPIPGGDPAQHPSFSPDSQSVVFWASPALRRIAVTGGVPVTVAETSGAPYGVHWSEHGIVFVQPGTGIMRVSPNGGSPTTVVRLSPADGLAHTPQLLPDGDTILFTLARGVPGAPVWDDAQLVAQSIKTGKRTTLVQRGSDGRYLPTGHLVYMVEGTLMAVLFDLSRMEVTSGAVPMVEGIRRAAPSVGNAAQFDVSSAGVLTYVPGTARAGHDDVFLYDRKGGVTALKLPRGPYSYPRVSPDGTRIALETSDGKQSVISVHDLSSASSLRRLTFGGNNRLPIWSGDSKRVVFQSDRDGDRAIFWQALDGSPAERLTRPEPGISHVPESWSPQQDVFLFSARKDAETTLWSFSMRDRKASRFGDVSSATFPTDAAFSPDGRWVAYQSGDLGTGEATTYVQPFPATGAKYEIARGGRPMWSRSGKELFYVPAPGQFMVVAVGTARCSGSRRRSPFRAHSDSPLPRARGRSTSCPMAGSSASTPSTLSATSERCRYTSC